MKQSVAWELSDALWEKVGPLIPRPERNPNKVYTRKPGGGRKPLPYRQVFAGILFVLRTGIQWNALPTVLFGSPSALNRYFLEWSRNGVFRKLWEAGLFEYDAFTGIDWSWVNIDAAIVKAPLARDGVGKNPTDRGKKGTKRHVLTDGRGAPLSAVITGANRNDSKEIGPVLDNMVIDLPAGIVPQVAGDKGYSGEPAASAVAERGMIPVLMQIGTTYEKGYLPCRWTVERTHSWMNRFRKLLVRYEKRAEHYEGLVQFSAALICFRMANIR